MGLQKHFGDRSRPKNTSIAILSNAKVAPDRRKVWNPWPEVGMFLDLRTNLRASLMWVSITWVKGGSLLANRGAVGWRGLDLSNAWRALTGHNKILSIKGS